MDNHKDGVLPLYGQIKRWIVGQIRANLEARSYAFRRSSCNNSLVSRTAGKHCRASSEGFVEKHKAGACLLLNRSSRVTKAAGFTADVIAKDITEVDCFEF